MIFKVCDMDRENYNIILPNEILLLILEKINRVKLSLVSYQFYTVNREFVAKCYHLHHLIPNTFKIIRDKKPKICIFNFDTQIATVYNHIDQINIDQSEYKCKDSLNLVKLWCNDLTNCWVEVIGLYKKIDEDRDTFKYVYNIYQLMTFLTKNDQFLELIKEIKTDALNNKVDINFIYKHILQIINNKEFEIVLNDFSVNHFFITIDQLLLMLQNSSKLDYIICLLLKYSAEEILKYLTNIRDSIINLYMLPQNYLIIYQNNGICIVNPKPEYKWFIRQIEKKYLKFFY